MEGKEYWVVSVPAQERDDSAVEGLNRFLKSRDLITEQVYKFDVPTNLRVGSIDSLMALSDDLQKIDISIENTVRKLGRQLWEVMDNRPERKEILINNTPPDTYVTKFKWEDARFSRRKGLKELSDELKIQVGKIEDELKTKSSDYNSITQEINAAERKEGGTLMVRDLAGIVSKEHITETDYLTTLFVVVAKSDVKEFYKKYENITEFILPGSAQVLAEDQEYTLLSVILFKKVSEDFKNLSREQRWTVRKYEAPSSSTKKDTKDLITKRDRLRGTLTKWCNSNFAEAFVAWVHLKCIRTFVESVLRFGLPANFIAMLVLPKRKSEKKVREALAQIYKSLGTGDDYEKDDMDTTTVAILGSAKFYPYVYLELNLDIWL